MIRLMVLTSILFSTPVFAMGSKITEHVGWLKDRSAYQTALKVPVPLHRLSGVLPAPLEERMQRLEREKGLFEVLETELTSAEVTELLTQHQLPALEQKAQVTRALPNSGWGCDYVKAVSIQKFRIRLPERDWLTDRSIWFRISYLFGGARPESVDEVLKHPSIFLTEQGRISNVTELQREKHYGRVECDDWHSPFEMQFIHSKFNLAAHILGRIPSDSRSFFWNKDTKEADSKIHSTWNDLEIDPRTLVVQEDSGGWYIDFSVTDVRDYIDSNGFVHNVPIEKSFEEVKKLNAIVIGKSMRIYSHEGAWKIQWVGAENQILPPKKNSPPIHLPMFAVYDLNSQVMDDGKLKPAFSQFTEQRDLPVATKRALKTLKADDPDVSGVIYARVTGWMNSSDQRVDCSAYEDRDGLCGRTLSLTKNDQNQVLVKFLWPALQSMEGLQDPLVIEFSAFHSDVLTYSMKKQTKDGNLESILYSTIDPQLAQRWILQASWIGRGFFGGKTSKDTLLFIERAN